MRKSEIKKLKIGDRVKWTGENLHPTGKIISRHNNYILCVQWDDGKPDTELSDDWAFENIEKI